MTWHLEKIPKTMFFYWGAPKISLMRVCSIVSFAVLNPDWRVVLMTPTQLTNTRSWGGKEHLNPYRGKDYCKVLNTAKSRLNIETEEVNMETYGLPNDLSEVHKSDFLRLYQLGSEGGFYSDTDIIFFRPISKIHLNTPDNKETTNLFCRNASANVHYIGFLGSSKNNQIFRDLAQKAADRIKQGHRGLPYQAIGCQLFKQWLLWRQMAAEYPDCRVRNLSKEEVYSFDHRSFRGLYQKDKIDLQNWTFGIGVHWFGGHPSSASIENGLQSDKLAQSQIRIGQLCNYIWKLADLGESSTPQIIEEEAKP